MSPEWCFNMGRVDYKCEVERKTEKLAGGDSIIALIRATYRNSDYVLM